MSIQTTMSDDQAPTQWWLCPDCMKVWPATQGQTQADFGDDTPQQSGRAGTHWADDEARRGCDGQPLLVQPVS